MWVQVPICLPSAQAGWWCRDARSLVASLSAVSCERASRSRSGRHGFMYSYSSQFLVPTDEPLQQGRNRSGLLRSFGVLAARVVPSNKPTRCWDKALEACICIWCARVVQLHTWSAIHTSHVALGDRWLTRGNSAAGRWPRHIYRGKPQRSRSSPQQPTCPVVSDTI